jgi:hypothetical protein
MNAFISDRKVEVAFDSEPGQSTSAPLSHSCIIGRGGSEKLCYPKIRTIRSNILCHNHSKTLLMVLIKRVEYIPAKGKSQDLLSRAIERSITTTSRQYHSK